MIQGTGPGPDIDTCYSGQEKRGDGISSFRTRARVWEIPVFRCAQIGVMVLMQAGAVEKLLNNMASQYNLW